MAFDALEVSLHLATTLRAPLDQLRSHDKDLADQARRAITSVALNISEGRERSGRDRLPLFRIASGSLSEARTALRIAQAWGYLDQTPIDSAYMLIDRLAAMLWRLTRSCR